MSAELSPLGRAALEYAERFGWKVFPLRPRSKVPFEGGRGFKDATSEPKAIRAWWSKTPDANIGLWCAGSGLVVLDADLYKDDCEFRELEARLGPLPETPRQLTPKGGEHYLFADGVGTGYHDPCAGAETKHQGYVVLAPSVHPDTGTAYQWDFGALPEETPISPLPEAWLGHLTSAPGAAARPSSGVDAADSDLGRMFAKAGMLGELAAEGRRMVCCPWADLHTDDRGRGQDSSTVLFPRAVGSTLGGFLCMHAHCRGRRWRDVLEFFGKGPTPATQPRPTSEGEPWPDPEPFDVLDLPPFPVESLSPCLRDWCRAEAVFAQVPVDLPAGVSLASASLAVARMYSVETVPGHSEPTNLWIVVTAPPGERKSSVFADATAPIHAYSAFQAKELAPKIADRARRRRVLQGQIKAAEEAAIKGKQYGGADPMQAARELQAQLDDLPEIHAPTLIADDCTPEALAVVLERQGERMGIFSAEGGPLEMMAGRYTERGSNFEIYLKAHSGDRHTVNRISRDPIHLSRPLVAMGLTVQPSVIASLSTKDGFRGRGLLGRFLYAMPQSALGTRLANPAPVTEDARRTYRETLGMILLERDATDGPDRELRMSSAAHLARTAFHDQLEPRLGPDGDLRSMTDWAGKLTGAVCRIAGVLHVADHAHDLAHLPDEIQGPTFNRASEIGRYFLAHAQAAFDSMGSDESTETAKRLWAWVERKRLARFTERDAEKDLHLLAAEIKAALVVLIERRLVRELPRPRQTGPGRPPSPAYETHPRARR